MNCKNVVPSVLKVNILWNMVVGKFLLVKIFTLWFQIHWPFTHILAHFLVLNVRR